MARACHVAVTWRLVPRCPAQHATRCAHATRTLARVALVAPVREAQRRAHIDSREGAREAQASSAGRCNGKRQLGTFIILCPGCPSVGTQGVECAAVSHTQFCRVGTRPPAGPFPVSGVPFSHHRIYMRATGPSVCTVARRRAWAIACVCGGRPLEARLIHTDLWTEERDGGTTSRTLRASDRGRSDRQFHDETPLSLRCATRCAAFVDKDYDGHTDCHRNRCRDTAMQRTFLHAHS